MKTKVNFIIILLCVGISTSYSQNNDEINLLKKILFHLKNNNIENVEEQSQRITSPFMQSFVDCELQFVTFQKIQSTTFDQFRSISPTDQNQQILFHIAYGDYLSGTEKFSDASIIKQYETAFHMAKAHDKEILAAEAIRRICNYFFKTQKNISSLEEALTRYKHYLYDPYEQYKYNYYSLGLKMQQNYATGKSAPSTKFSTLIHLAKRTANPILTGEALQLTGSYYMIFHQNKDSTTHYYTLASNSYAHCSNLSCNIKSYGLEINRAILLFENKEYKQTIAKLDSLRAKKLPYQNLQERLSVFQYLKSAHLQLHNYKQAYQAQEIEKRIQDSLDLTKHKIAINDIQTFYKTKEKEHENLQLKKDKKNLLLLSGILLSLGLCIIFLLYKNMLRKQKIAAQEREIEVQRIDKILKEQELQTIDAMILGQEKERQRIANDLHDDLGSTLASAKLHFQHLHKNIQNPKIKDKEALFTQTNLLLEEAYQQVRTIAHEKNSGVMANQGLLPAIKQLAKKISAANKLQITVQDYNLEERLDNTLEISIFRIIQELITNTIKHADATEVDISLTNHDALLNIIVEDNGKGFDATILPNKDGMGLKNIEKRVEYLEGTFEIDSTPHKGTNIIINIPI